MVSARSFRRDKMDMLIDAGLATVEMGVQSGSQRVLDEVFNRPLSIVKTKEVVRELGDYERRHGLSLVLDFIIDNPWETREDVHQTVRYLLDIPPRTLLNVFFLTYFPGTPVYDRAVAEGIIKAFSLRAFRPYTRARLRFQRNWEAVLILLIRLLRMAVRRKSTVMDTFLRLCVSRPVRLVMGLLPRTFFAGLARGVQLVQFTALRLKERKHRREMERAEAQKAAVWPGRPAPQARPLQTIIARPTESAARRSSLTVYPMPSPRTIGAVPSGRQPKSRSARCSENRMWSYPPSYHRGEGSTDAASRPSAERMAVSPTMHPSWYPIPRSAAMRARRSTRVRPPFFDSRKLSSR